MSNENRTADDSRGLKEVLAVFSEVARKTSETEEPAVPKETVLAVFSEVARKTSEAEEPAVTNNVRP